MKAQGATEYLVLLAVVLIVALVSVALLGFFPGMASDAQMTQSQTYWSGTARPFQVKEASSSAETMCGVAWAHGYALVLQNAEADTLTVTSLTADNSSGFCVSGGTADAPVSFGAGERKTLYVMTSTGDSPCTEKQIVQLGLNITYRTTFLSGKVQSGTKKLMLRCSTSIGTSANATGGNATQNGSFRIHTFTSSGTFTPNESMVVEVLVVAGGGGGGSHVGGGGGGGGLLYYPSYAVTNVSPITVVVGQGGTGAAANQRGGAGSDSVFGSLIATGGGGGGTWGGLGNPNGISGGSGGGASGTEGAQTGTGGTGTPSQGNRGGNTGPRNGWTDSSGTGGGGAGATAADREYAYTTGRRNGGPGLAFAILGTSYYFAGGGGSGAYNAVDGGNGGAGGGGGGASTSASAGIGDTSSINPASNGGSGSGAAGGAAATNSGGGGGAGAGSSAGTGGSGGSGIVIVRYR